MPANLNEFIWWVFLVVISICGFFAIQTLSKIDRNQTELFNRMRRVEDDLSELKGAHNTIMAMGGHK